MRLLCLVLVFLAFVSGNAHAAPRQQFTVSKPCGKVLVESFGDCVIATCRAVVILSGSKGFAAPVYDEIGQTFLAAGLNGYLVHLLSEADLDAMTKASGSKARIVYSAQRLPNWISAVQGVVAWLETQPQHDGKVGILGISLGAQIASAASVGRSDIDALVLVDGGFPNGYAQSVRSLPPLHLIWGSADRTFPLSIGRELQRKAQQLGGSATLEVYDGGAHDFLLRSGTRDAEAAQRSAANFLTSYLSR